MFSHNIEDYLDPHYCVCKYHPEQQKNNDTRSSISFGFDHHYTQSSFLA